MESNTPSINKPLNKIDLRKVLSGMENDYQKIKINISNYEKDYDLTINNISLEDDFQNNNDDNSKNINEL